MIYWSLFRFVFLAGLLALAVPSSAQGLANGGFEQAGQTLTDPGTGKARISGTIAGNWQDGSAWGDVTIAYSLDTHNPHSGRESQKIQVQRGFAHLDQPFTYPSGGVQTASVWIRSEAPTWATLAVRQGAAPYNDFGDEIVKVTPAWTQVKFSCFVPAGNNQFEVRTDSPGTLWVDDAALTHAATLRLSPPTGAIPRAYFGMHINHLFETPFLPWPSVDFGTARTVDSGPYDSGPHWAGTEKSRGVFDWKNVDGFIDGAQRHHFQVIFNMYMTPQWAASNPTDPAGFGRGAASPPANIVYWEEWVQALATHCKGRVTAYEVWNEPDLPMFWSGTPAQMAVMELSAARIIKKTDPQALVIAAPTSGGNRLAAFQWYDQYLSAGGGKAADVLGNHFYGPTPEDDLRASETLRHMIAAHGLSSKPLWNTETGWGYSGKDTPENTTIANLGAAYLLDWALGIKRLCWYSWSEVSLVGVRPGPNGTWTLNRGAVAYAQLEHWLVGSRMLSCVQASDGTWTCVLRRPDGAEVWIVWNTGGSRSFTVPRTWRATHAELLGGQATRLSNQATVTITATPLLLAP